MRTAQDWLIEYAATHRNPRNKLIHMICVPLIYWSVFALVWWLGLPWLLVAVAAVMVFYFMLGWQIGLAMLSVNVLMCVITALMASKPLLWISIGAFVAGWIGQFIGHQIEGEQPAFFDNLFFLLIGPLWVLKRLHLLP